MSETGSRIGRTIGNLLLALINATLILVALCLFLGWQLSRQVETITGNVAQNLTQVEGLRSEVSAMTAEMAALRSELSAQRVQADPMTLQAMQELSAKLDGIDGRLTDARSRIQSFLSEPTALVDRAVDGMGREMKEVAASFGACPAPQQ